MTAKEFLVSKKMMKEHAHGFYIHFENGTTIDLCKVMEEFKNQQKSKK